MMLNNIFDQIIEEDAINTPIAILKELAQALTNKTQGLLTGDVTQNIYNDDSFSLEFYIKAPSLNNYRYHVVSILHDLGFYPLEVNVGGNRTKIENRELLEQALEQIFTSAEVKRVINGLLSQIKAA